MRTSPFLQFVTLQLASWSKFLRDETLFRGWRLISKTRESLTPQKLKRIRYKQEYIRDKSVQLPILLWYIPFLKWCSNASPVSMATILILLRNAWILLNSFAGCVIAMLVLTQLDLLANSALKQSAICCRCEEMSRIARLVSLFKVIPVEHKCFQRFHVRYVRILIRLPCWRVTRYYVILEKGCITAGIGGCTLLSLMYSWYKISS